MCLYSVTRGELRNNLVAHNTALKFGGGLECAKFYGEAHSLSSFNNTWLNNTALIRGGGVILHPCNFSSHSDAYLGNSAGQEGGGFMVYGGEAVTLSRARVACNTAQNGGGVTVKLSDNNDKAALSLVCSSVTANGGAGRQDACLAAVAAGDSASAATATAAPAAAAGSGGGTEKGGGLYVATDQEAAVHDSAIVGNVATSSGGGVYMDRDTRLAVSGRATLIGSNNCTDGSGGGVFLEQGTKLVATGAAWVGNQVRPRRDGRAACGMCRINSNLGCCHAAARSAAAALLCRALMLRCSHALLLLLLRPLSVSPPPRPLLRAGHVRRRAVCHWRLHLCGAVARVDGQQQRRGGRRAGNAGRQRRGMQHQLQLRIQQRQGGRRLSHGTLVQLAGLRVTQQRRGSRLHVLPGCVRCGTYSCLQLTRVSC